MSQTIDRFVALDVHKHYVVAGAVNVQQEVVLRPRRVPFTRFAGWIARHLRPTDAVVIEATTNAWHVYDLVAPLVAQAVVAHAYRVKLIAALRPWALVLDDKYRAVGPRVQDKCRHACPEPFVPGSKDQGRSRRADAEKVAAKLMFWSW